MGRQLPRLQAWNVDIDRYINRVIPAPRLHLLPRPLAWLLGHHSIAPQPIGNVLVWWWGFIGAVAGILAVGAIFRTTDLQNQGVPVMIASLGATAILEYHTIDSPLAQPRNAFFGSIIAAAVGVSITKLFRLSDDFESLRWIAGALSVGVASALMGLTKTVHPPAGATALLCATDENITNLGWFFIPMIILGISVLLAVACLLNNIQRRFPVYWWTGTSLSNDKHHHQEKHLTPNSSTERSTKSQVPTGTQIVIDRDQIHIPEWVSLAYEETAMLQVIREKLKEGYQTTKRFS